MAAKNQKAKAKNTSASKPKTAAKAKKGVSALAKAPKKEEKVVKKAKPLTEAAKRRSASQEAMKAAMKKEAAPEQDAEEEFDPAAFFKASGMKKSDFRAHVMRKERVDLNIVVRYRYLKGPLVFNADLLNLSKGGLCIKGTEIIKAKTVLKIEIPLPHTSELFAVQAEVMWSTHPSGTSGKNRPANTGLRFLPMSLAKQAVINNFIQQRRDEVIMAKIGLESFTDSVPVAGLD